LEDNDFIKRTAPRIKGHALSFLNKKTMGASIIGIDLKREFQATSLKKRLTHGAFFEVDQREIVIGRKIARTLRATLGDDIVLISSGADGSIANDQYRVVGIIDNGENGMDDHIIYMSIQQAQEFFSLWGRVHEIVILTQHMPELYIKNKLVKKLSAGLTVSSWDEVEKDFYKAMQADRKGDSIIRFIIMFVVAIGVLNTVLMSILERTREFGVLKALGTTPKSIFLMITLETLILALLSISIGFVCAYLLNYYFSIHGIPFEAIEYGGFVFDEMRTNLNYSYFITPALVVMLVSIIVSVFPALKAAKTIPIEAMNS
jgi:ABC-type lipoprotein release transport system permease subunit